jgi:hypothetical protein
MIAICNGSEVVYLLSDEADISGWPLIVDGGISQINGIDFPKTVIADVDLPANTKPSDCERVGGTVQIRASVTAAKVQAKLDRWEDIKVERDRLLLVGGYPCGGHWFHSDVIARSQHQANARKADRVEYAGGDMNAQLRNADDVPIYVKSKDNGYMAITATLAQAIVDSAEVQEMKMYGAALAHKAAMEVSTAPASYDYLSSGWPECYVTP